MGSGMKLVARRLQLAMQASASECQAGSTLLGRGEGTGVLRACPGVKVGLWEHRSCMDWEGGALWARAVHRLAVLVHGSRRGLSVLFVQVCQCLARCWAHSVNTSRTEEQISHSLIFPGHTTKSIL